MAIKRTRNEYEFFFCGAASWVTFRRGMGPPQSKRPRTMPGPSKSNRTMRSVPRDNRAAAPIEAIDQLATDRLDVFLGVLEAERGRPGRRDQADARLLVLIGGETILRLPVQ